VDVATGMVAGAAADGWGLDNFGAVLLVGVIGLIIIPAFEYVWRRVRAPYYLLLDENAGQETTINALEKENERLKEDLRSVPHFSVVVHPNTAHISASDSLSLVTVRNHAAAADFVVQLEVNGNTYRGWWLGAEAGRTRIMTDQTDQLVLALHRVEAVVVVDLVEAYLVHERNGKREEQKVLSWFPHATKVMHDGTKEPLGYDEVHVTVTVSMDAPRSRPWKGTFRVGPLTSERITPTP